MMEHKSQMPACCGKNNAQREETPLVHARMIYRCEACGRSWSMFLEKGIEEFGENHKPSPFMIGCPYCGGWAMDVSGIQKTPYDGYMPLPYGASYFANLKDRDCGIPIFSDVEAEKEFWNELVKRASEQLKRMIDLTVCAEEEEQGIEEASRMLAEGMGIPLETAGGMVLNILGQESGLRELLGLLEGCYKPPGEFLVVRTVWDRIEEREKQRIAERETVSRFRQHKNRESLWSARKRTRPRQREWRGPWKEN